MEILPFFLPQQNGIWRRLPWSFFCFMPWVSCSFLDIWSVLVSSALSSAGLHLPWRAASKTGHNSGVKAYTKDSRAEGLYRRRDHTPSLSPLNAASSNSVPPTCGFLGSLAGETERIRSCRPLEGDGRGEGGDSVVCGYKMGVSNASLAPSQIPFEYHIYGHTTMYVMYSYIYI